MTTYRKSEIPEHLLEFFEPAEIGAEKTPEEFIAALVAVFREVKRVLRDDGTLWVNMGDSYAANRGYQVPSTKGGKKHSDSQAAGGKGSVVPDGCKPKDLIGIPWMLAFALRADGWFLRQEIIWAKPNPMPESVTDRCTKSHEQIFLLSKSQKYYFDAGAIQEPAIGGTPGNVTDKGKTAYEGGDEKMRTKVGLTEIGARETRNKRSVWTVSTKPYSGAHFAVFPADLIEPCILAGAPAGGVVLDPFMGSGTTAQVAQDLGRQWIGCELNPAYAPLQNERIAQMGLMLEAE